MKPTPYANASSGHRARDDIRELLAGFGCKSVGFMDDFEDQTVLLAFRYKEKNIQLKASAKGWARLYCRNSPRSPRSRTPTSQYESAALRQGMIAVNSILRDWIKGQMTAIECGVTQFDHVFLPYMVMPNGQTVAESVGPQLLEGKVADGAD